MCRTVKDLYPRIEFHYDYDLIMVILNIMIIPMFMFMALVFSETDNFFYIFEKLTHTALCLISQLPYRGLV